MTEINVLTGINRTTGIRPRPAAMTVFLNIDLSLTASDTYLAANNRRRKPTMYKANPIVGSSCRPISRDPAPPNSLALDNEANRNQ